MSPQSLENPKLLWLHIPDIRMPETAQRSLILGFH
jgi:hypothetical protein